MNMPVRVPDGEVSIAVKLINPVTFGPAQIHRFMAPAVPGLDAFTSCPSNCFLLEHPSGRKLVWDLGIRKDYHNYSPSIASYIPTTKYDIEVTKNVADILQEDGIDLNDIEAVIWSHWHWDHIGDPSTFPPTVQLIVGPGFKQAMLPGAPANPDSPILESDYTGRPLREITFDTDLHIGRFPAYDYFGDGSLFLLDTPGHAVGHLCAVARTSSSPDTFVLLGGDVCHYSGILRPSIHMPCPEQIVPHPLNPASNTPFCPGHAFAELQESRGRKETDPVYEPTFGLDVPLAIDTIKKLQELDCDDNIFVIIAHDSTVTNLVDHFPNALNAWKEKGWGQQARWAFLKDLEKYWESRRVI